MTRLFNPPVSEANGQAAQIFAAIKGAMGMVPNAYAVVGNNSPQALAAALHLDDVIRKSSLSAKDAEIVKLAVSQESGCDYCLAAHTMISGKIGMNSDQILAARHGKASGDARHDALSEFVHLLVTTRGTLPEEAVLKVRAAGVTDAQIVDTMLAITSITFTNLINRVNNTVLDFPPAP